MKLIRELVEDVEYVTESKAGGGKNYFIEGIFLQQELVNRNFRKYPANVMEAAVNKYVNNYVADNRGYGELGHPSGPTINPERISHRILSLEQNGNNWIGKAQISSTPYGEIAKGLMEDGGRLGVSSRGLGSLRESGGVKEVQGDFFIATAGDIVVDPSAPDAFVDSVMENVEWVMDAASGNWSAMRTIEEIQEAKFKLSSRELQEHKVAMFEKFLTSLR